MRVPNVQLWYFVKLRKANIDVPKKESKEILPHHTEANIKIIK